MERQLASAKAASSKSSEKEKLSLQEDAAASKRRIDQVRYCFERLNDNIAGRLSHETSVIIVVLYSYDDGNEKKVQLMWKKSYSSFHSSWSPR